MPKAIKMKLLQLIEALWLWVGDSPAQWEYERQERHRIGEELVRQYKLHELTGKLPDDKSK